MNLRRIIALLLVLVVVQNFALIRGALGPVFGIQSTLLSLLVAWLWLLLAAGSTIGLALDRSWGVYLLAALATVSTVLLSVPLVPVVTRLAPESYRPYVMIALNVIVLAAGLSTLRGAPPSERSPSLAG